jgi:outer membrane protein assembly factor BamB
MRSDFNMLRLFSWAAAGLFLVVGLAGYWYFDGKASQSDPASLQRLREASLPAVTPETGLSFDWPQWRGPLRDGISWEVGLSFDWPANGPPLLWRAPCGPGYSGLAVSGGRVFTLMQEGDQEAAVCWDADTGRELWRFRYPCSPLLLDHGDGPRSTPTVDGDLVYLLGAAGDLHCLTVAEGRSLWHHDMGNEFGGAASFGKPTYWGYACSPLVEGESVFTMTGGTADNALAAFDKRSGKIIWKALNHPLSYSSPIGAKIDGMRQIVFFTGRGLVGVFTLWHYPWEANDNCNVATPIAAANYLFLSSGYDRGCAVLEIKRTSDGVTAIPVYSNKRMRNHFATSILYQEHIYGFDNFVLVCMEFRTGKIRWKKQGFGKGSLLIGDGHLFILSEHGKLTVVVASPEDFLETASFEACTGRCWIPPSLANGRLYVRNQREVLCFDLRKR